MRQTAMTAALRQQPGIAFQNIPQKSGETGKVVVHQFEIAFLADLDPP